MSMIHSAVVHENCAHAMSRQQHHQVFYHINISFMVFLLSVFISSNQHLKKKTHLTFLTLMLATNHLTFLTLILTINHLTIYVKHYCINKTYRTLQKIKEFFFFFNI